MTFRDMQLKPPRNGWKPPAMTADQIVTRLGGNAEAARRLGVERNTIVTWKKRGIPYRRRLEIARILKVRVDRVWNGA